MSSHSILSAARRVSSAALTLAAFSIPTFAAPPVHVAASDVAFERSARGVGQGGKLTIEGYLLEGDGATSTLELERFEVWRPDAVVLVDGKRVAVPRALYFRGSVAGYPGSSVLLSVRENGAAMGMVFRPDGAWAIGKGKGQSALRSKKARPSEYQKPFSCGLDDLRVGPGRLGVDAAPAPEPASTVLGQPYVATVAVETDYEYYTKFGNQQAALDYMGDLFGYADLVYSREIDTDMTIGFARIWTTNSDPYPTTTSSSTALTNFRNYWNANMRDVKRTVAHMLSGMETGGGVAWVGVLCDAYGSPGGNYSYGYSGTLDGNFNWDGNQAHNPSSVVWDVMVVQHEIGHNFNSPHSHDYCNIGPSSQPIDQCWASSTCGTPQTGLPSCTSSTPFFNGGAGTIMSYCHQVGGYNAIAMTFGEGHTCGTLPGREADRMSAFVVSRSNSYPACFVPDNCGNGVVDPGEDCDGLNLNGGTCAGEGFVGGTLACTSSCTYDTSQCHNCGNNVIDVGEVCDGTQLIDDCSTFGCSGGLLLCNGTCSGYDQSGCTGCPACNNNFVCEPGEDCTGCPNDCPGGTTSGAVCGNGVCEAGNGENCVNCVADCNGVQNGKPSGRFCCGNGGTNPIACGSSSGDTRCSSNNNSCTLIPVSEGSYCCGNDTCEPGETCALCAVDCNQGPELCTGGIDEDCNGYTDCADPVCEFDSACLCGGSGAACSSNSDCCSNNCRSKGKKAGTCA